MEELLVTKEFQKELIELLIYAAVSDGLPDQSDVDKLLKYQLTPIIFLTSVPRAGATWLLNTLSELTNTPMFRLCSAYGINEHDLYLPALALGVVGCTGIMHTKGTYHNNRLLKMFNIKPIILIRNIYDAIINLANNIKVKQESTNFNLGLLGFPFFWGDASIKKLDDNEFLNWIIDFAVPWYVNFYASWYRLQPNALWITCEKLVENPYNTIEQILTYLQITPVIKLTDSLLARDYPTADGEPIFKELTIAHKIRIAKYFTYYSEVDFGKHGLVQK